MVARQIPQRQVGGERKIMEIALASAFDAVLPLLAVIGTVVAIAMAKSAWDAGDVGDDSPKVFLPNLAGGKDYNPANQLLWSTTIGTIFSRTRKIGACKGAYCGSAIFSTVD